MIWDGKINVSPPIPVFKGKIDYSFQIYDPAVGPEDLKKRLTSAVSIR